MTRLRSSAVVVLLWCGWSAPADAQDFFPGGWSPNVGSQPFSSLGTFGTPSPFGGGFAGLGGSGMFGSGSMSPYSPYAYTPYFSTPMASTAMGYTGGFASVTNSVNPLIHSIRHATKRRRGGR